MSYYLDDSVMKGSENCIQNMGREDVKGRGYIMDL